MGNQDTLRNLSIAAFVFVVIMFVAPRFLVPTPQSQRPEPAQTGATTPGTGQPFPPSGQQPGAEGRLTGPGGVPSDPAMEHAFSVIEVQEEQTTTLGAALSIDRRQNGAESPYRMRLTLSNIGASVESATMTDHAAVLDSEERYELLRKLQRDDGRTFRSLAVEKINLDGVDLDLSNKKWHVEPVEQYEEMGEVGERLRFWIEIQENDAPALKITRTLTLPAQAYELQRHDLHSRIAVENLSDQSHQIILTYLGGLGIGKVNPRADEPFVDRGVYDGTRVSGLRKTRGKLTKSPNAAIQLFALTAEAPRVRLAWAATANTYFTCTLAPTDETGSGIGDYVTRVLAVDLDGDITTEDDTTVRFVTQSAPVAPSGTLEYTSNIYLGDKNGDAFRQIPDYTALNYYYQVSQGYGSCTFTFLVELMIWLLSSLYWMIRDFGVGIIVLVLLVRVLLHPITKKGQVNMVRMQQRMQEMQPKIEEIKRKYANDKARMNQEMMKLNINPAGQLLNCLPMMIQMPIWFALYISLSNNILIRHQAAFYGLTWIDDLTAPDALYTFGSPIHVPVFGWELPAFNLLPLLLALFMYLQQKLQPKPKPSPTMTDQQRQQQEMMQKMGPLMSIMMLLVFYKMPSGLNLYIMTSSLFGIIEQHRIRKHIKEREAAGTLHKEPVKEKPETPRRTAPGKMNFFQKLQKMAEDAKKQQAQRRPKPKPRR